MRPTNEDRSSQKTYKSHIFIPQRSEQSNYRMRSSQAFIVEAIAFEIVRHFFEKLLQYFLKMSFNIFVIHDYITINFIIAINYRLYSFFEHGYFVKCIKV